MPDATMPIAAVELMAAIMEDNARQSSWVYQQLMEGFEADRKRMSEAFADLYDALCLIPEESRSVRINRLLDYWEGMRGTAVIWGARQIPGGGYE